MIVRNTYTYPTGEEELGFLRVFDPLPFMKGKRDVVMNLTTFFESNSLRVAPNGTRSNNSWHKDLKDVKKNIEMYDKLVPSVKDDFLMELVISVNGSITDDEPFDYLKSIDDTYISNGKIHVTVFQRPNIGWQWGALQDVWAKLKGLDCDFWMTQESDCFFKMNYWFDILRDKYKSSKEKVCFISGHERTFTFGDPYEYNGPLNKGVWRDKNNNILKNPTEYDIRHVDPLYYFISRQFLEELDDVYGCFTFALSGTFFLDAIIYGEIGFCQKARALGYKWLEYEDIVFGWDHERDKITWEMVGE